ncbi:unnamed protein product [Effrenium voratum]|nr:unnamed protein product [Effrenium voratum]
MGESLSTPKNSPKGQRALLSIPLEEVPLEDHCDDEDREINEVLSFNASIYDLTIQYCCLFCSGFGAEPAVLLNLVLFIALQLGNVCLQMFLLFEIEFLIAFPAMQHARHLYDAFTASCYDGIDTPSVEVKARFESWDAGDKTELCQFPLTNPTFFYMVILIWTFFLGHELKQTVYFFWHTVRLQNPSEGMVYILDHEKESHFVITHMSKSLKFWIGFIVFLPKFIIAIVLWYIGARWLTATPGVDNLMLNSLALTFICELDELIFRTCTSENIKANLERTKLPMPPSPVGPSVLGALETTVTVVGCFALAYLYLTHFQTAIPDYRWDLADLCRASASGLMAGYGGEEQDLRTTAVWETLRCLASKCLCAAVRQAAKAKLSLILWLPAARAKVSQQHLLLKVVELWHRLIHGLSTRAPPTQGPSLQKILRSMQGNLYYKMFKGGDKYTELLKAGTAKGTVTRDAAAGAVGGRSLGLGRWPRRRQLTEKAQKKARKKAAKEAALVVEADRKRVLVEFGAYVGYSAVRLSRQLRRNCLSLVSLEVNPVHVCISRRLLDLARVSWAEVKPGQAKDLVPKLIEELGERCAGLIFMDHRGTIFHQDLALLVRSRALAGQARLIADNTLNPGAPLFLWERFHSHCVTQSWALQEFLAHHEDWTTTSAAAKHLPRSSGIGPMVNSAHWLRMNGLRRLQSYTSQAAAQVKSLLDSNNLPTDLQLHSYMRELVKALDRLTSGAPEPLRRAVARPFEAVWNFQENKAIPTMPLKVEHLVYVLESLESLLLAGHEVMGEIAVREINYDARRLIAGMPLHKALALCKCSQLIRGVEVNFAMRLAPDGSHHILSWWFRYADRNVHETVLYWDEHFEYGSDEMEVGFHRCGGKARDLFETTADPRSSHGI